jgi:hypothetical protein
VQICRRRGHSLPIHGGWEPCEWCGLWLREKRTIEEREDEPSEEEMSLATQARRDLNRVQERLNRFERNREDRKRSSDRDNL